MIKKRKYKKRKRNPKYVDYRLIEILADAIRTGSPMMLINAIIYYNQGEECNDCGKDFNFCQCEKCSDCGYDRCLCDLGFTSIQYWTSSVYQQQKYSQLVSKKASRFAKQILNKEQLKELEKLI